MVGQVQSGLTLRPPNSQPGRFIYAAEVSSLCPGDGLGALDAAWRRSDFILRAVGATEDFRGGQSALIKPHLSKMNKQRRRE